MKKKTLAGTVLLDINMRVKNIFSFILKLYSFKESPLRVFRSSMTRLVLLFLITNMMMVSSGMMWLVISGKIDSGMG